MGTTFPYTVAAIPEHELAFVIGAPQRIGLERVRELGAERDAPAASAAMHQAIPVQHRMDRTDGRQVRRGGLLPELLPNLRGAPSGVLPFQTDDHGLDLRR